MIKHKIKNRVKLNTANKISINLPLFVRIRMLFIYPFTGLISMRDIIVKPGE